MRKRFLSGFTLIELSLSIAFIGILSIAIALIINDTIASYRRGMTLNQINTTGMDLVDDLRAAVQNSSANSVKSLCASIYSSGTASSVRAQCETDGAHNFVSVERLGSVTIAPGTSRAKTISNVPVYGAFCTGTYSYIWNSGYFFGDEYAVTGPTKASLKYKDAAGATKTISDFRLLKVRDDARAVCMSATLEGQVNPTRYKVRNIGNAVSDVINNQTGGVFDLTKSSDAIKYPSVPEEPVELLGGKDNMLAIYDLRSATPAQSNASNNLFYSVSFVLATITGGVNVKAGGNYCATPEDYAVENFDYCSINKFNFAVQATGE